MSHLYVYIYLYRSARAEEPIWGEDEGFSDHDYYNSIPGKEPPIGGVVDSRLRGSGAPLGHVHSQPLGCTAAQVTLQTDDVNGVSGCVEKCARWHLCLFLKHARRRPDSSKALTEVIIFSMQLGKYIRQ